MQLPPWLATRFAVTQIGWFFYTFPIHSEAICGENGFFIYFSLVLICFICGKKETIEGKKIGKERKCQNRGKLVYREIRYFSGYY